MAVYTDAIQKLYVAYFSRPADAAGLAYWEGVVTAAKGSTAAVSAAFAASAEYKAAFAGLDEYHIVDQIYLNLFGRHAEPAGLQFWGQNLIAKKITVDNVVTAVAGGALGTDQIAYNNKVTAATAFTAALDLSSEILGYSGAAANAGAANFIAGVTTDASLAAAIAPANLDAVVLAVTTPQPVGTTFVLTGTPDTLTGTAANDTFVGNVTIFDSINGGAGNDTLNVVDTATTGTLLDGAGATIAGVETVSVLSAGGVNANTTTFAGTTKLNITSASTTGAVSATVADTTDVFVNSAGTAGVTVAGGKAVIANSSAATAGAVSVTGAALTSVSTSGGSNIVVDNVNASGVTAKGTSLTSATVFGATGSTVSLSGASLTNVSLSNILQADAVTVNNATAAHALNLSLSAVGYTGGAAPTAVAVSVADAKATSANITTVTKSNVALSGGLITTATLAGAGALALNAAAATTLTTVAGAAATGATTLTGLAASVATVTTGSGNDKITLSNAADAALTISTGDGNDSVAVNARGAAALVIDLGAGTDTLTAVGASINAGDTVNGGAGVDTLTLALVGSANIGAFAGFELFDAVGLGKTLDVDILVTKNTVTEVIASNNVGLGAVTTATLTNLGAGVNVRATGDMAGSTLVVTQKVAGAITITADMDETGTADTTPDVFTAAVSATNATSANIVFGTDYLAKITGESAAGDNITTFNITTAAATSATVVAGGTSAVDVLNYTDASTGTTQKLGSLTVTGAQALTLNTTTTSALATVDASAHTGGLTFNTASLKDGGKVMLGSGVDKITVAATSVATSAGVESISGIEKTLAISLSAEVADADAAAAAIADADTIVLAGGIVADAGTVSIGAGSGSVTAKGVLTFSGAGPSTLADAFLIADAAANGAGEVLVFNYLGDSYVFQQAVGLGTDVAVKLVGVTGITNIVETGTDMFFIV